VARSSMPIIGPVDGEGMTGLAGIISTTSVSGL
jgi:hypothetical protein